MSTNAVPLVRAAMAYSLPVVESVQPQPPLPEPPPMLDSGRLDCRSMFLQAYPPAEPLVHVAGAAAVPAVGAADATAVGAVAATNAAAASRTSGRRCMVPPQDSGCVEHHHASGFTKRATAVCRGPGFRCRRIG